MFRLMKLFVAFALLCMPLMSYGQTENPRGIYKMVTLTGKVGEIKAPFDQYKICTDSGTIMVSIQKNVFKIGNTDHMVFNYTGDQPKTENDHSSLIYDSNSEHFTLKWWSENKAHLYFPDHDWCIEKYQAGEYSEMGRIVFDVLQNPAADGKSQSVTGIWRVLGYVDELNNVKQDVKNLQEKYEGSKYANTCVIVTPTHLVYFSRDMGMVVERKKMGKVKWLSKNSIAVEEHIDYRTDYQIWERLDDNRPFLEQIAGKIL